MSVGKQIWKESKLLKKCFRICRHRQNSKGRRAAGKEKTATYRQYFGNRMFYKMMLDKYKQYGLL